MPAPIVKGIIITLTLLTALGAAALANPQVRAWVEEQRRKVAEALRALGDEFDPQVRRQAEAFAFEGRIPGQRPEAARRESDAARNAVARATGRETGIDLDETSRRLARVNSGSLVTRSQTLGEEQEVERRRMGREYLAKRNAEMLQAKEKARLRKSQSSLASPSEEDAQPTPADEKTIETTSTATQPQIPATENPWSFDSLVDQDGSLKSDTTPHEDLEQSLQLPSPPTEEPKSFEQRKVAILEAASAAPEPVQPARFPAFNLGSHWSNPFGDEFELEDAGYATPKPRAPAVPPKIALDPEISVPEVMDKGKGRQSEPSSSFREVRVQQSEELLQPYADPPELDAEERERLIEKRRSLREKRRSLRKQNAPAKEVVAPVADLGNAEYEEDLARALSLSTAEEERRLKAIQDRQAEEDERNLAAAIAASLADQEKQAAKLDMTRKIQQKIDAAALARDAKLAEAEAKIEENTQRKLKQPEMQMLVDLTPDPPVSVPQQQQPHTPEENLLEKADDYDSLYDVSPEHTGSRATRLSDIQSRLQSQTTAEDSDDLYSVSPDFESRLGTYFPLPTATQYDPVHEAATENLSTVPRSLASPPAEPTTSASESLVDVSEIAETSHTSLPAGPPPSYIDLFTQPPSTPHSQPPSSLHDLVSRPKTRDGTQTPTTATLSPQIERDAIAFSTSDGEEDEFLSAEASLAHSRALLSASHPHSRRASTASFSTDAPLDDFSETESLIARSEADGAAEVVSVDDDDSSDDEWADGVRTPGSEWTDVGSVVSEEEVGGQDSRRLAGA